MIMGGNAKATL